MHSHHGSGAVIVSSRKTGFVNFGVSRESGGAVRSPRNAGDNRVKRKRGNRSVAAVAARIERGYLKRTAGSTACVNNHGDSRVEYKFIQNHFHPKRVNFIQNHFHPNTTFIPKPLSSQTSFIQNHFHPKTISSKTNFIPKTILMRTTANKSKNNIVRVCVKATPAEGRRRLHTNTAYARLSGFNRPSCGASPAAGV